MQPTRNILPLVHKSLQDNEIYCVAQIQMDLHWHHRTAACSALHWSLLVFIARLHFNEDCETKFLRCIFSIIVFWLNDVGLDPAIYFK
ncbi:hypothetical protein AB205_0092950 [Aquarana catesbeiana]|uniref:Uncharacterized protein n=1 Tax=Aquarana catesbeiana TaxID=8400 RepID=A0A2G9S8L9_AQUCT|nr:hypothetical protein AB205_0092950 [Aquarana catesbeiana]